MLTKTRRSFGSRRIGIRGISVALYLAVLALFQPAHAQPQLNIWSSNGPNAQIYSLVADPNDLNTIYAGGPGGYGAGPMGVVKSINNGASWSAANTGLGNTYINSLAMDPVNSNILYAGTAGGLFKSTNAGSGWISLDLPIDAWFVRVAKSSPNTIYVADGAFTSTPSVFISLDGGATWAPRPLPAPYSPVYIGFLAIDPHNPDIIYTTAWNWDYDMASYKSTNGGMSWTQYWYGDQMFGTTSIEFDPARPDNIYAATDYGVLNSVDGGINWTHRGPDRYISALTIDPLDPKILYAGTGTIGCCSTGVYKSIDAGTTWSAFNNGLTNLDVSQLAFDRSGRFLHAATRVGVFSVRVREDAAFVSISGRVTTPDGRGLRNATVSITDPLGIKRRVTTSSLGFFSFDNVASGGMYTVAVSSKLYRFASQTMPVTETLTDLNFVGVE